MIKRTLFFGNPAYLAMRNAQLVIKLTDAQTQEEVVKTVPIEDIGVVVLENLHLKACRGAKSFLFGEKTSEIPWHAHGATVVAAAMFQFFGHLLGCGIAQLLEHQSQIFLCKSNSSVHDQCF